MVLAILGFLTSGGVAIEVIAILNKEKQDTSSVLALMLAPTFISLGICLLATKVWQVESPGIELAVGLNLATAGYCLVALFISNEIRSKQEG